MPRRRPTTLSDYQTETQFQNSIIDYAKLRGWLVFHDNDSRRNRAGFPDLVLAREGEVVFAELKSQHGRIRPEQHQWLESLAPETTEADGATHSVYLWRPADWTEIERVLQ